MYLIMAEMVLEERWHSTSAYKLSSQNKAAGYILLPVCLSGRMPIIEGI